MPPSDGLDFEVLEYPKEAVKSLNATVENVKSKNFNSKTDNKIMFVTDKYANVTFK